MKVLPFIVPFPPSSTTKVPLFFFSRCLTEESKRFTISKHSLVFSHLKTRSLEFTVHTAKRGMQTLCKSENTPGVFTPWEVKNAHPKEKLIKAVNSAAYAEVTTRSPKIHRICALHFLLHSRVWDKSKGSFCSKKTSHTHILLWLRPQRYEAHHRPD